MYFYEHLHKTSIKNKNINYKDLNERKEAHFRIK